METSQQPRPSAIHDGFAIASLVLGLCWLGGLGAVLALIFGSVSLGRASQQNRRPSNMAVWGMALGGLGLVGAAIIWGALLTTHQVDPTQQWLNCLQTAIDNGDPNPNACPAPTP